MRISIPVLLAIGIVTKLAAVNSALLDAHNNYGGGLLLRLQTFLIRREMRQMTGFGESMWQENLCRSRSASADFFFATPFLSRLAEGEPALWGLGLYTFSPLSIFFGQAVMPEMMVQFCAFGFVLLLLRYADSGRPGEFFPMFLFALIGLLTKLPAFSHLGLLALAWVWSGRGEAFVFRQPLHYLGAILLILCVPGWVKTISAINNAHHFGSWSAEGSNTQFLGTIESRLDPFLYLKMAGYSGGLLLTPVGTLVFGSGLFAAWPRRNEKNIQFGCLWLGSVAFFYLVWGVQTAGNHNYYNLPALGPACLFFGLGAASLRRWVASKPWPHVIKALCSGVVAALLIAGSAAGSLYLFRQDVVLGRVIDWTRENIPPEDGVILVNYSFPETIRYMHQPAFAYYTGRRTWMWVTGVSEEWRKRAINSSQYRIVIKPQRSDSLLERFRRSIKNLAEPKVEIFDEKRFFQNTELLFDNEAFSVWKIKQTQPGSA